MLTIHGHIYFQSFPSLFSRPKKQLINGSTSKQSQAYKILLKMHTDYLEWQMNISTLYNYVSWFCEIKSRSTPICILKIRVLTKNEAICLQSRNGAWRRNCVSYHLFKTATFVFRFFAGKPNGPVLWQISNGLVRYIERCVKMIRHRCFNIVVAYTLYGVLNF